MWKKLIAIDKKTTASLVNLFMLKVNKIKCAFLIYASEGILFLGVCGIESMNLF